jgi:hypothetical protein
MTAQQKFCEKMFCEEEPSDHQQSILLVDIMNALGYSKIEREIYRHTRYLLNEILSILRRSTNKDIPTMTGSVREGLYGGIYDNHLHHDTDILFTIRNRLLMIGWFLFTEHLFAEFLLRRHSILIHWKIYWCEIGLYWWGTNYRRPIVPRF